MSVMNFVNNNNISYSSSTSVKPTVGTAVVKPVPADTEDDNGINPTSLLTQFNDNGEYSSLIPSADTSAEEIDDYELPFK